MGQPRYVVDLSQARHLDLEHVGKKALELAELKNLGILIPDGFVITTSFFTKFLEITGIARDIDTAKESFHPSLSDSAENFFQPVKEKIMQADIPYHLISEFHQYFRLLTGEFKTTPVDIFSSSKTEKSIRFEDILGDANVVQKIKEIWSSHFHIPVALVIVKHLKTKIRGKVISGELDTSKNLTAEQTDDLQKYCKIIQNHLYFPKEIDYAVENEELFITRIKPFTGDAKKPALEIKRIEKCKKVLIKGVSINPGIATGPAKILNKLIPGTIIKKDEILVIPSFNNSLYNYLKKAKAVIADSMLANSADLALYRKIVQVPTVEGVRNADKIIRNGNVVTVNGITGEIYSGGLL
jgi:phosphoenolpyruvate synthase/pyruvate phosphate dikinase